MRDEGSVKVSVQFPMKTESENVLRSLPFAVASAPRGKQMGIAISIARSVARQRAEVRRVLDSQLPRLKRSLPGRSSLRDPSNTENARPNFFRVTLIRISAGTMDTDGLEGALKHVRDEVATWLGCGDGPHDPASWRTAQQKGPAKTYAVRIEIEDDDPDPREVHRIVGPTIARLGPVVGDSAWPYPDARAAHVATVAKAHRRNEEQIPGAEPWDRGGLALDEREEHQRRGDARRRAEARAALRIGRATATRPAGGLVAQVARGLSLTEKALRALAPTKCRYLDRSDRRAAEQVQLVFRKAYFVAAEDGDDITLEELTGPLFEAFVPPPRIRKNGRVLVRRLDDHPALGEHWIYEAAPSVARPIREESTEAKR